MTHGQEVKKLSEKVCMHVAVLIVYTIFSPEHMHACMSKGNIVTIVGLLVCSDEIIY